VNASERASTPSGMHRPHTAHAAFMEEPRERDWLEAARARNHLERDSMEPVQRDNGESLWEAKNKPRGSTVAEPRGLGISRYMEPGHHIGGRDWMEQRMREADFLSPSRDLPVYSVGGPFVPTIDNSRLKRANRRARDARQEADEYKRDPRS